MGLYLVEHGERGAGPRTLSLELVGLDCHPVPATVLDETLGPCRACLSFETTGSFCSAPLSSGFGRGSTVWAGLGSAEGRGQGRGMGGGTPP